MNNRRGLDQCNPYREQSFKKNRTITIIVYISEKKKTEKINELIPTNRTHKTTHHKREKKIANSHKGKQMLEVNLFALAESQSLTPDDSSNYKSTKNKSEKDTIYPKKLLYKNSFFPIFKKQNF